MFKDYNSIPFSFDYPKFLAIKKIWVAEKHVEVLVNTPIKDYYLVHFEVGDCYCKKGLEYGYGDVAFKDLTGQLLNPYFLNGLKLSKQLYVNYKTKSTEFSIFAHINQSSIALWLNRGDYKPAIIL